MRIEAVAYDHQDAVALIDELQAEYVRRYGGTDATPVEPAEFAPPRGLFLVAYVDGAPAACGGWRAHDSDEPDFRDGDAEIKRMYVVPLARGLGLARALLAELERTAAVAGRRRIILETGAGQPEAIGLYTSAGYTKINSFGFHRDSPGNRCFGKFLAPALAVDAGAPCHPPRPASPSSGTGALGSPAVAGRPLTEIVEAGWAGALEPVADRIAEMGEFLRAEIAAGRSYLPAGPNVLRAFSQPFDQVRVLIVGQDPYPTPGHAVGLSFSVAPEVRPLPRSLVNIFNEYAADLGHPLPANGDLSPWAERGVLLLNRSLTVRPGKPGSHRGVGWEQVTEQAIIALAARGGPLAAILWGRDARNLRPLLGSVPCVESAHPSPNSAHYGFFGSRPFSRVNALLAKQGADPIDWKLP
jgi:uracil-DNA glycosylase